MREIKCIGCRDRQPFDEMKQDTSSDAERVYVECRTCHVWMHVRKRPVMQEFLESRGDKR